MGWLFLTRDVTLLYNFERTKVGTLSTISMYDSVSLEAGEILWLMPFKRLGYIKFIYAVSFLSFFRKGRKHIHLFHYS